MIELNKIIDEHTFIIAPSHSEGMPNVILEAMSRGLIPLATHVGAIEEIIDNNIGFLFEPRSIEGIRNAIEASLLLTDTEALERSSNSIKKIRENFTWSQIISQTKENFQRLVEKT